MNLEDFEKLGPNPHIRHVNSGYATVIETDSDMNYVVAEDLAGHRRRSPQDKFLRDIRELATDGLGERLFTEREIAISWATEAPLKLVVGALIDLDYRAQPKHLKPLITPLLTDISWNRWWESARPLVANFPEIRQLRPGHFRLNRNFSIDSVPDAQLPKASRTTSRRMNQSDLEEFSSKLEDDPGSAIDLSSTNLRQLINLLVRTDRTASFLSETFTQRLVCSSKSLKIIFEILPGTPDSFDLLDKCIKGIGSSSFEYPDVANELLKSYVSLGDYIKTHREVLTAKHPAIVAGFTKQGFELVVENLSRSDEFAKKCAEILEAVGAIDSEMVRLGFGLLPTESKIQFTTVIASNSQLTISSNVDRIGWALLPSEDEYSLEAAKALLNLHHDFSFAKDVSLILDIGAGVLRRSMEATISLFVHLSRNIGIGELPRDLGVLSALTVGLTSAESRSLQKQLQKTSARVTRGSKDDGNDPLALVIGQAISAITESTRSRLKRNELKSEREVASLQEKLKSNELDRNKLERLVAEISSEGTVTRNQDIMQARREIVAAVANAIQISQHSSFTRNTEPVRPLLQLASTLNLRSIGTIGEEVEFEIANHAWKGQLGSQASNGQQVTVTAQGWEWITGRGAGELLSRPWVRESKNTDSK